MDNSNQQGRFSKVASATAKSLRRLNIVERIRNLKAYALFISMMLGIVLSPLLVDVRWFTCLFVSDPGHPVDVTVLTTYLLFCMLFITYCKVSPKQMRLERMHLWLLLTQWIGCWVVLALLFGLNPSVACGAYICIFISTATSAPVITGMLGGSVPRLATYCIMTNLSIAVVAPLYFSLMGLGGSDSGFLDNLITICRKVMPLALGPFFLSIIVKTFLPKVHNFFVSKQIISFWLWCVSLVLLMARTTGNLLKEDSSEYVTALLVALSALGACLAQFYVGRRIGRAHGDAVVGGQSLGQKNTILAIWMAQSFFDPKFALVSVAPATYVLWQNLVNSWQMWRFNKAKK